MTTAITPTVAIERWKAQRAQEKAKKAATEAKPVIAAVHPASQDQRWKAVKECIAKGDKAAAKAEDFYIKTRCRCSAGTKRSLKTKPRTRRRKNT